MIVSRIHVFNTIAAAIIVIVNGQATHIITVGGAGRAIEPPFLVAELNDVVTFLFNGDFHGVTQSTFENPFVPLLGGFDGGPPIGGTDGSMPVRTWNLYITDALHRQTIWFFCKAPQNSSNCTEGAVGSINPQNQTMFDIFVSVTNRNSCTSNPTLSISSSSAPIPTSVHEVSSVIPSSTQSFFASSAPTEMPSTTAIPGSGNRHRGAIIGGAIGGVFGIILILFALLLCHWRRRSHSRDSRISTNPFQAHKNKLDSNAFNVGPRGTPPPSASSDKHPPSQLNADGAKIDILGSPSLGYIGGQQSQNQSQSQQKRASANAVHATLPGPGFGQQADVVNGPSVISCSSPDEDGLVLLADPKEADPAQHLEHEEIPLSTHHTPLGARLRQDARAEEAHPEYGTVIGIDLGTSYSRVGVQRGGVFEIIANEEGQQATSSWVCFTGKKRLVGDFTKDFNPNNTVFSIKRLIGRKMGDLDVVRDTKRFPFQVTGKNGAPSITVKINSRVRSFTPEEIAAAIITKMKEIAETHLGYKVTHAVLTVPACFNDAQRQATKDAGEIAGLNIVRILNETTAAAIAHGLDKKGVSRVVVYSLGGGFFDISLLAIDNGVIEVLATAGDTHLGGEDFDNRVVDYLVEGYKKKTGRDISQNVFALIKLRNEAERAKRILSSEQSASIEILSFENGNDFSETLTRTIFEDLNIDLFNKTIKLVEKVLKDANCKKEEVNEILVVGGSTHIPRVQQLLNEFFSGKEPVRETDSDNTIVRGAVIQGGILSGTATDTDIILVDACPHSRGIETIGGVFNILIPRNTVIPNKKSEIFTTTHDNQTSVEILVFEGEHPKTKHNNLLGSFRLTGIPPAPRHVPQINVTFEIDANGIMQVRASDLGTGNSKAIRIFTNKGRLSREEILRMQTENFVGRD